ncbi:MAG: glycosyltransferase family 2 protein [Dysgonamonadaceae bacterium]|jgi:glycosyltransferase involved in cell wall biosynthesis|nr:glycosyltransferase family 2 protein [Dysgonamonadaceae bacterium]
MKIGVIISTYNNPRWLEKTLWGYACQSVKEFELIIADDGSGEETKNLIANFQKNVFPAIKHIWHKDEGFRKCTILNKAIVCAESEYLIFTDQDCIPRKDFIETHQKFAESGYFLSGGYFRLNMEISLAITKDDIFNQNAFQIKWLKKKGLKNSFKNTKLLDSPKFSSIMNFITPTKATWNGMNSSGWKTDFLKINGFNETMLYGGEDREFGERLFNLGIRSKQIRYSAICLHLDHPRPYKNAGAIRKNLAIRRETRRNKVVRTDNGIVGG